MNETVIFPLLLLMVAFGSGLIGYFYGRASGLKTCLKILEVVKNTGKGKKRG